MAVFEGVETKELFFPPFLLLVFFLDSHNFLNPSQPSFHKGVIHSAQNGSSCIRL